MEQTRAFDEGAVRLLLAGSAAEVSRAVGLIDKHLGACLRGWLRKQFPGLDADDLAEVWAETRLALLQAARAGRFDPARPLVPWLCRIARARAADELRRGRARRAGLEAAARALGDRGTGRCGKWLAEGEGEEVARLIRAATAALPSRQRLVFRMFLAHYPESMDMEFLRREVSRASGRAEKLTAVKRALQEARAKVRALLRRSGYALDE